MKRSLTILTIAIISLLTVSVFTGCKTTEANYRSAYEQAKANRAEKDPIENTIYNNIRQQATTSTINVEGNAVSVKRERVKLAEPRDEEKLADYYVLTGQFKQIFNARSLRNRISDNGYPKTTILMTAEPLYYIGIPAETPQEALRLSEALNQNQPVAIKEPYPLLFQPVK